MQGLHVYNHFSGIWRYIDDHDYGSLSNALPNNNASLNSKQQGYTPLYLAVVRHNLPIIELLLRAGADPNLPCRNRTPLLLATLYGEYDIIQLLLNHGAKPDIMQRDIAPIHLATSKGIIEICRLLWQYDADLSIISPKYGTPLHVATKLDHKFIAGFLIDHGARVDLVNAEGETPLHMACRLGREQIARDILKTKINPSMFRIKDNSDGFTIAHAAAFQGKLSLLKEIINIYPKMLIEMDAKGKTVLFYIKPSKRTKYRDLLINSMKLNGFPKLINNKLNSDITLNPLSTSNATPVYAHKAILWARWPMIKTKIDGISITQGERIANLDIELESEVLNELVYYLYTDKIQISKKEYSIEAVNIIEKLRKFAYSQELNYLVTLCNSTLNMYSKNTRGKFKVDYSSPEAVLSTSSTFQEDLSSIVNQPKHSDVTFTLPIREEQASKVIRTEILYAHKAILSSRCDYFAAMFDPTKSLKESRTKQVTLEGFSNSTVLNVILEFLYTWTIPKRNILLPYVENLIEATSWMMLPDLQNIVEIYVIDNLLDKNSVYDLVEFAYAMNCNLLKEECLDYLARNKPFSSEEYFTLDSKIQDDVRTIMYEFY